MNKLVVLNDCIQNKILTLAIIIYNTNALIHILNNIGRFDKLSDLYYSI